MASFNISDPDKHSDNVQAAFGTCLIANDRDLSVSNGLQTVAKTAGAGRGGKIGTMRVLAVVYLVALVGNLLL